MNTLAGPKQPTAALLTNRTLGPPAILFIAIFAAWSGSARATPHASVSVSPNAAARAGAVSGVAPVLDPPAAMRVHGGETSDQALHATDADGDPLSFTKYLGPSYMTVTTTDPGSGSASGNIRLAPSSLGDGGTAMGIVTVYDNYFYYASASFSIVVTPILDQPANMTVDEETTADQRLTAFDSDGHPLTFSLVSGPTFATVTTTSDSTGNIHLAPGFYDAGSYRATVSVTEGVAAHEGSFQIAVRNVNRPPVLTQPADMHAAPYTVTDQVLTASDPDGEGLTFVTVAGPRYMSVSGLGGVPHVRLDPSYGDTGTVVATVGVSDGTAFDQKPFTIRIDLDNNPPALNLRDIDIAEGTDVDQTFVAVDPDGQRLFFNVWNAPRFAGVAAQPQAIGSDSLLVRVLLLPAYDDFGIYRLAFRISDGWDAVSDTLKVTVRNAYPGETSLHLDRAPYAGNTPVTYEYSAVDGVYGASSTATDRVTLNFQSNSGSGARWTAAFVAPHGSALAEGDYTTVGSNAAGFSITGSDTTVPAFAACGQGTARFQIRRIVRRLDGSILSFWATFQQTCADLTPGLGGEVRYQAQGIPITLVAPRWLNANANERFLFRASAVDTAGDAIALSASGLPAGAGFLDLGNGQGTFGWIPSRDQVGDYLVRTVAASAGGLADTALTSIHVVYLNHAPEARSNGPYTGTVGVPLPFTSSGSGDQDGDALSYRWTFGDGGTAEGPSPAHIYRAIGPYPIALIVSDGVLLAVDNTLARISWPDSARAFEIRSATSQAPGTLRLQAGGGRFCVAVEIVDSPTIVLDVDRFSFRLEAKGWGSVDAISADPTELVLGDADANGIPDVTVCFSRAALRNLFEKVSGRSRVDTAVEFSLLNGHGFRAPLPLEVIGPDGRLQVLVAPNPFRHAGMFSFVTTRVGAARLTLFDARGRPVRTPLDTESLPTGYHDIPIDARAEDGTELSSGVYFYHLQTPEGTRTGRMAIIK